MNVLFLRHSVGYAHSSLPDAEVALKELGSEHGWSVRTTHQCEKITADALEQLDVLAFATGGNIPLDTEQRSAILGFVRTGTGFVGLHSATASCYDWPEFAEMLGGWFNGHPWHQEVGVIVEDRDHPATAMLGDGFRVTDEVYTFKNWDRSKTNVLMRLDNETVDLSKGNRDDEDYALGWYHEYGEGRVIYSALGHPDMLWRQSWFREHVAACVEWVGKR